MYRKIKDGKRNIWIYSKIKDENFGLFILNDGDLLDQVENNIIDKIERQLDNFILVAVEPLDRFTEYTPWYHDPDMESVPVMTGQADNYINYLIGDLFPLIEDEYKIKIKRNNTFIAGSSLGGLLSSYAIFTYPEYFSGGIFVSASFWYPNYIDYLKYRKFKYKDIKIYMDVGDREKPGKLTLGKDVVKETDKIYNWLIYQGINEDGIKYIHQKNMGHNISFFIDRIYDGIIWIWRENRI